jgi:hypothetical protein
MAIGEAILLARANDKKRIVTEQEVVAEELSLNKQDAALSASKMRRMI